MTEARRAAATPAATAGAAATPAATAGAAAGFRCSAASRVLDEPLEGTASTVRAFLLLEAPGPWGVNAVRDCRIDEEVRQRLLDLESGQRIRPLLVRRPRSREVITPRLFAAYVDREHPWVESTTLDDVRDLLDLDLSALGRGHAPGMTRHHDPLFLVCTHGRHDACCAELGRPLSAAMAQVAPDETWEVSHIGGDRFAANVLVLPHGLYYGRLSPPHARRFVEGHREGRLDLEHLRGRSSYPFDVQAAEVYLRRHLAHDTVHPLPLVEQTRDGAVTTVVFAVEDRPWRVRVRTAAGALRQLTCRATSPSEGLAHTLVEMGVA